MISFIIWIFGLTLTQTVQIDLLKSDLPTLYEYYAGDNNIRSGLSVQQPYFTLNNKNITLLSGAMHYFRIHPEYWRSHLRKLRASGLLAVETYMPWNLHEPQSGIYDFGSGGSDFESFLDAAKYIKIAQEEDLLVIVRPGPYICAEFEFGGLPSWLLREDDIKIRTSDKKYFNYVKRYFVKLLEILTPLQFTKGGPIIAFQIENEYGSTQTNDKEYLKQLKNLFINNGVVELLFTSDPPTALKSGTLPGVFATVHFKDNPEGAFKILQAYQPGKPFMVMEYWSGWYDFWTEKHHTISNATFSDVLKRIITYPGSVNIYMFCGGTNWGFLNGANIAGSGTDNDGYHPIISSYDYDSPLSENGDYTDKYFSMQRIIETYSNVELLKPPLPELTERVAYSDIEIIAELTMQNILNSTDIQIPTDRVISMELLPINNNSGQSYGYIVYRTVVSISANSTLKIKGRVCDTVMVLVNGELKSNALESAKDLNKFGYWRVKDSSLSLGSEEVINATLDLVVENWGRNNYGSLSQFNQKKGLWQGDVLLNDEVLSNWVIMPLEFKKSWLNSLKNGWQEPTYRTSPALYRGILNIDDEPKDTYIDLRDWTKGIVIVNQFVLSRYLKLGPQQTAYLPAPLLKRGTNEILIFEHFVPDKSIKFVKDAVFETLS